VCAYVVYSSESRHELTSTFIRVRPNVTQARHLVSLHITYKPTYNIILSNEVT